MAEALGIAAGAIGAAGFAVQLAQSVTDLKSFCGKIKDAPAELREYLEKLGYASKLLDKISTEISEQRPVNLDNGELAENLKFTQRALGHITAVTGQFEVAMINKRYRTSIRFALE